MAEPQEKTCWCVGKKLMHFGSTTTSRAESTNSFLKKSLASSVGDLLSVFREFNLAIEHQIHELRKTHEDNKFKRPSYTNHPVFVDVVYKISSFALAKCYKHMNVSTGSSCSLQFSTTWGIPCGHILKKHMRKRSKLSTSEFHAQWHLGSFPAATTNHNTASHTTPMIQEAVPLLQAFIEGEAAEHTKLEVAQLVKSATENGRGIEMNDSLISTTRGRPLGSSKKAANSTQRDPSGFEYFVESAQLLNNAAFASCTDTTFEHVQRRRSKQNRAKDFTSK